MKVGVLKNDILDREHTNNLRLARSEDILDDCAKESRGKTTEKNTTHDTCSFDDLVLKNYFCITDQKEQCSRAYVFLRCVTILNLIFDDTN